MKKLLLMVLLTAFMLPGTADARYHEGDLIEDFSLPDTSGSLVSLSDFSDKIVCIYFWAST
ncbi:MAG: redoxin domain-containing protein [FCB group bacterium]|nr:redoxin domain-containing protein [FCB group bacterium]